MYRYLAGSGVGLGGVSAIGVKPVDKLPDFQVPVLGSAA